MLYGGSAAIRAVHAEPAELPLLARLPVAGRNRDAVLPGLLVVLGRHRLLDLALTLAAALLPVVLAVAFLPGRVLDFERERGADGRLVSVAVDLEPVGVASTSGSSQGRQSMHCCSWAPPWASPQNSAVTSCCCACVPKEAAERLPTPTPATASPLR